MSDEFENPPKKKPTKVVRIDKNRKRDDDKPARIGLAATTERLRQAPWAGVLGFNERTLDLVLMVPPPCMTAHEEFPVAMVDADFTSIVQWFATEGFVAAYENVIRAVIRAATFNAFDPVRDYLDGLEWDGTERLDTWLEVYFGADVGDDLDEQAEKQKWLAAIGLKFLNSAVARVYEPGCQVDTILVAEGPQGYRKSTGFQALAVREEWFACDVPNIGAKDAVHHLLGPWIVEFDELDALNRKETSTVKSFVTRRADRARLSYGKLSTNHPRRVVFCGTTNEEEYNADATGGRRFWPFKVRRKVNVEAIKRDRDQLWAEAVHHYRAGVRWYLDDDDELHEIAKREQERRFKRPPMFDEVERYCKGRAEVTIAEILDSLDIEPSRQSQHHQNQIRACLMHLGRRSRQVRRPDGTRPRIWEMKS